MEKLKARLRLFFSRFDAWEAALSSRWREHANRRTTFILLFAGMFSIGAYVFVIQPPDSFPTGELVSIPSGESLHAIAETLKANGVIRSPLTFQALVMILGRERGARAGDYLFKEPTDVWSVARAISVGAFGLEPIRIRIPEGATTKEMAAIFDERLQRFDPSRFLEKATPKEGYFFPDTYFFLPNANEDTVIDTMSQDFDEQLSKIRPAIASSTHSFADIVTMASILEREARNPEDRRLIAGVLWNRIARGMALQVDATFLYTIGKGSFDLTMKDLTSDSPYNTYVNKGLPPTPIGSPSLDSILAAANPTKSDYLYYLADKHGVTHYSKTYAEHLRKKRLYLGT
jgi:UPF0755 protein